MILYGNIIYEEGLHLILRYFEIMIYNMIGDMT